MAANLTLAEKQRDEYRAASMELSKLKVKNDNLKQDHESLKISLESSERIRKQQKDLIKLLQRSSLVADQHLTASAAASVVSCADMNLSTMSVASAPTAAQLSSSSVAEQNRSWLNASMSSMPSTNGRQSASASVGGKARRTRKLAASSDSEAGTGERSRMRALNGSGGGHRRSSSASRTRASGTSGSSGAAPVTRRVPASSPVPGTIPTSRRAYTKNSLSGIRSSGYGQSGADRRRAASASQGARKPSARSIYGDFDPMAGSRGTRGKPATGRPPRCPVPGPRAAARAAVSSSVDAMESAVVNASNMQVAVAATADELPHTHQSSASSTRQLAGPLGPFVVGGAGFQTSRNKESALLTKSTKMRYEHKGHPYAIAPFHSPPQSPVRSRGSSNRSSPSRVQGQTVLTDTGPVRVQQLQ